MDQTGYIQVYTGDGKGKTTAGLGLALRGTCAGFRVYIGQFLKGQDYAELKATQYLPQLSMEQYGLPSFVKGKPSEKDLEIAKAGFERATEAVESGYFDIVILDEINTAVDIGIIEEDRVLKLMDKKPEQVELVLTGRGASPTICAQADLVTEMKAHKHYYDQGVMARKGIEF